MNSKLWILPCLLLNLFQPEGKKNYRPDSSTQAPQKGDEKNYKVGSKFDMPNIIGLDGKKADLHFDRYDITVIDFWNTGCPPCIAEMKQFAGLIKNEKKIQVISISINQYWFWKDIVTKHEGMFGYLSEQLPNWQQVTLATVQSPHLKNIISSDRVKEIESTYRIYYYPTNFAVNSKGVIVARPVSATEYIKQAKQSAKPAMAK